MDGVVLHGDQEDSGLIVRQRAAERRNPYGAGLGQRMFE